MSHGHDSDQAEADDAASVCLKYASWTLKQGMGFSIHVGKSSAAQSNRV